MKTRIFRSILAVGLASSLALGMSSCGNAIPTSGGQSETVTGAFFNSVEVHSISVEYDEADYQAMLAAFADTGDKEWVEATVTIDGQVFEKVGLRLKGNSSLQGLGGKNGAADTAQSGDAVAFDEGDGTVDASSPQSLPWLIRLDKYVDGVSYSGRSDFVVRGNNTESSLNEAVALAMLSKAGVVAQQSAFTRFSINGSAEVLRLVIDDPDDQLWNDEMFPTGGNTYKADSDGDYSYRGDDASAYTDIFTQRTGTDDLTPISTFLQFINESSDVDFESELEDYLDTNAFATYLAAQDLIGNSDDISGPGNNSYLHFDLETGQMTVVAWDHNLAFGAMPGMGGAGAGGAGAGGAGAGGAGGMAGAPGFQGGQRPDDAMSGARPEMQSGELPTGMGQPPTDLPAGGGGFGTKTNALVDRFEASTQFSALYEEKLADLTASLVDSGFAQGILDDYAALLKSDASDLVSVDVVESDAQTISNYLAGDGSN